ncbi:Protein kinase superfamily protein [Euphorbia peplus]|nr:Protein kinase superfamily protein [Euphorbia peplus]
MFFHLFIFPVRVMWHMTLILMLIIRYAASEPPDSSCSLDLPFSLSRYYNSSCIEGGDCCESASHAYLHALGRRANHTTGRVFLNSEDQTSCLAQMEDSGVPDCYSCGIDKLTSGKGGCSDYSVVNITHRFRRNLNRLSHNCKLQDSDGESEEFCTSCKESWQEMTDGPSVSGSETDVCRFAVLVSLISTSIDDEPHIHRVYRCLLSQNSNTGPVKTEGESKFRISTGIWILMGCIIGAVVVISIVILIVCRRRYKRKSRPEMNACSNLQLKESRCRKFPPREVYSATENLSSKNLIGQGTAGKVYKGRLSNNHDVAIKHITNDGNAETVVREVTSLCNVRHPNLVALLGYCAREDECFLIYELCPKGNLSQWIFGKDKTLSWKQRIEIAIDSARGLLFLHTYSEGCIVHRDIKPTNILLGQNFEAKLSDFGLCKVINLGETCASSEVRGTFGYVDPEYQNNRLVNSSGDVYSFGIVLLQILSGKKVINMDLRKPMPLEKMAKSLTRGGSIIEFADPKLNGKYSAEAFILVFQLALSCTALKQQRPSMEQVVTKLEEALHASKRVKDLTSESTSSRDSTKLPEYKSFIFN